MAKLVHHNLKQIKFVFDETIHRKDDWRDHEVSAFSQLSQLTIFEWNLAIKIKHTYSEMYHMYMWYLIHMINTYLEIYIQILH